MRKREIETKKEIDRHINGEREELETDITEKSDNVEEEDKSEIKMVNKEIAR